jgi:catechol 2,3-dioxygenase-like lactoylglutathione lyase family enzyme
MITGIAHVCYTTSDLGAASEFYCGQLGLRHAFDFVRPTGQRYGVFLHVGGGANLTNLVQPAAFVAAFGRQGRFIVPALDAMGPTGLREFFARLGVPTVLGEGTKVFAASQSAAQVQAGWAWARVARPGAQE